MVDIDLLIMYKLLALNFMPSAFSFTQSILHKPG
jgi:hypothetical protein